MRGLRDRELETRQTESLAIEPRSLGGPVPIVRPPLSQATKPGHPGRRGANRGPRLPASHHPAVERRRRACRAKGPVSRRGQDSRPFVYYLRRGRLQQVEVQMTARTEQLTVTSLARPLTCSNQLVCPRATFESESWGTSIPTIARTSPRMLRFSTPPRLSGATSISRGCRRHRLSGSKLRRFSWVMTACGLQRAAPTAVCAGCWPVLNSDACVGGRLSRLEAASNILC